MVRARAAGTVLGSAEGSVLKRLGDVAWTLSLRGATEYHYVSQNSPLRARRALSGPQGPLGPEGLFRARRAIRARKPCGPGKGRILGNTMVPGSLAWWCSSGEVFSQC